MDMDREKQIGIRLRAFRETLQIPRSRFAVSIGYGSERIASYESGRAPVRYEVFRAISQRYHISAFWLATGQGAPKDFAPVDDIAFIQQIKPNERFSAVYDRHFSEHLERNAAEANAFANNYLEAAKRALAFLENKSIPLRIRRRLGEKIEPTIKEVEMKLSPIIKFEKRVEQTLDRIANEELHLPSSSEFRKTSGDMKPALKQLLDKVRKLTDATGMKAKLASDLKVPQARVSEWLSGKHDPSGETTLQLLKWVQLQERKS